MFLGSASKISLNGTLDDPSGYSIKHTEQELNMLLQYDGQPFLKVSQAIVALQQKLGIKKPSTIGDARKSLETYANHLDPSLQKTKATFLCHSEDTRDKVYRHTESKSAVDALFAIESLTRLNTNEEDPIAIIAMAKPIKLRQQPTATASQQPLQHARLQAFHLHQSPSERAKCVISFM